MVSKRKKGESSSSAATQSFDKKRFVSYEASKRYHQWLTSKNLILEQCLLPDQQDGRMVEMIRKWKWEQFVGQPETAAVNIVKEFYTNAKETDEKSVFVQGKWVKMGRKVINNNYGLRKCKFSRNSVYINEDLDYNEAVAALCEAGTDWRVTVAQEATNFLSAKLSHYEKAWFPFICVKLMPARHKTDVTKERATLLFYIAKGKTMDVGELIHASIKKTLEGSTSGGLPHPSLITDLCKHAGVKWDSEEVLQAPLAPIVHSMIARYKVWEGGMSHPNGLRYMIIEGNPDVVGPSQSSLSEPSTVSSEIPGPSLSIIEELRRYSRHRSQQINMVASQMERAIQCMDMKMDCIAYRQEEMHSYNISACTSLTEILLKMNPTILFEPFPLLSKLSVYPPSDLDNDEEGSEGEDDEEEEESDN